MTLFEALMRTNKLNPHGRTFDQNIEHLNNISKCGEKNAATAILANYSCAEVWDRTLQSERKECRR